MKPGQKISTSRGIQTLVFTSNPSAESTCHVLCPGRIPFPATLESPWGVDPRKNVERDAVEGDDEGDDDEGDEVVNDEEQRSGTANPAAQVTRARPLPRCGSRAVPSRRYGSACHTSASHCWPSPVFPGRGWRLGVGCRLGQHKWGRDCSTWEQRVY